MSSLSGHATRLAIPGQDFSEAAELEIVGDGALAFTLCSLKVLLQEQEF